MPKQLKVLTFCWLIYSVLTFIGAGIATIVLFTLNEDRADLTLVASLFGVIGIICVFGLTKRKAWAWAGILALAIVNFRFVIYYVPIGLVLGVATFWVLFKKEIRNYFWAKPAKP